jgi:transcriptional regulator with XRE-family HTH domain
MGASPTVAEQFGARLLQARTRAGISQEALGLRAGLHRTEIGLLERAERIPRIDTLIRLAGALDTPTASLLEGITWNPGSSQVGAFRLSPSPDAAA